MHFFQVWVLKPDQPTDKGPISSQFLNSLHSFKKEILITKQGEIVKTVVFTSQVTAFEFFTLLPKGERRKNRCIPEQFPA